MIEDVAVWVLMFLSGVGAGFGLRAWQERND
jgi:hypothetical protein